jgi:hypothetical protein
MSTVSHANFSLDFSLRPAMCLAAALLISVGRYAAAADFYEVVEIPKPSEEAPVDLGVIPAADVTKCTFRVIPPTNADGLPVGNNYKCEPAGDAWKIFIDKAVPLATLKFQKDHLMFQWEHAVSRTAATGIRNCLLQVGYGDARKFLTLRKPARAPAAVIDLRHDTTTLTPDIEDLPEAQFLTLEVSALTGYDSPVTFDPDTKQAVLKEPVRIIVKPAAANTPGMNLNVVLSKLGTKLQAEMLPLAVTPDGLNTRPLTLKSVAKAIEDTKSNITTKKSKLAAEEKKITPLETKLGSMSSSTAKTGKAKAAFESQVNKLQTQLDEAKLKVDDLRKQIPEMEALQESLPGLLKLANDLNEHAAVEFRVLYLIGKQQIVLFATEKAPIEPPPVPKDENAENPAP